MKNRIKAYFFTLLLGGCLCFCACGQENVEPSSEETPAPLEWEDVVNPDGTIDRDKYSQYVSQGIPEADPGKEEVPENVILLGAMISDYQYIKKQITTFNLAQGDFQVQVQRYESADAMLLDLVRGQGCDLLALTPGYLKTLADKGSLEELGPYLEKSGSVNREELFGAVLEAGTAGGKLVGILPGFNVQAILVEKGYTRDGGWTVEEYLALMDKYPDVPLSGNANPEFIPMWLMNELSALPESFVDWDERSCRFDSEDFIQAMEMLKDYAQRCQKASPVDLAATFADRLYSRQVQTRAETIKYDQYFSGYYDILDAFGDAYELAGWPNQEGEARYPMTDFLDKTVLYSMNAASAKKDGAWRFLEYLLSDYQEAMAEKGGDGFPARRDVVERLLQEEVEAEVTDGYFTQNFYTQEMRPKRGGFTEEDKEQLLYILDHAVPSIGLWNDRGLWGILVEELNPFIAGDKTVEDMASVLQNRVTTYLKE